MRMTSPQLSLSWTCMMRTRPEGDLHSSCFAIFPFFLFRFSFLLLCTPSMGVLLSEEELPFPEHVPGCQAAKVKLS